MPLSQDCHHKHTRHLKSHSQGAGRGAARPPGGGDTVPECTVRPAATTSEVPANCAVQPALPYAAAPILYIYPTASETAALHAEVGAGRWPDQAIIVQNKSTRQLALPTPPARKHMPPPCPSLTHVPLQTTNFPLCHSVMHSPRATPGHTLPPLPLQAVRYLPSCHSSPRTHPHA